MERDWCWSALWLDTGPNLTHENGVDRHRERFGPDFMLFYIENQKTMEHEDDFKTKVMNLKSPKDMWYSNCAV